MGRTQWLRWMVVAVATVSGAVATSTADAAVTTTWTNPNGGAWSNPANWSHGVPAPGDLAILPGLGAPSGYEVVVTGVQTAGVVQIGGNAANIRLSGGGTLTAVGGWYVGVNGTGELRLDDVTVNVSGPTAVGGAFGNALLSVGNAATFTTSTLTVAGGASGSGTLSIIGDEAVCFATLGASIGTTGAGSLVAREGATLAAASLTFGSQASTILTLIDGQSAPVQLFGQLKRGGFITVLLDDAFVPVANVQLPVIATSGSMIGQWLAESLPEVYGEFASFVPTALGEMLEIPDPFVDLIFEPSPIVIPVGFSVEVDVYARRLSGVLELICCDEDAVGQVSLSPVCCNPVYQIVSTQPITLFGQTSGSTPLYASLPGAYPPVVGSTTVVVKQREPSEVRRVSETTLGTEGSLDTPPLSPQLSTNTFRVSRDGRYVLFSACAPEFLPQSGIGACQLYLKDLETGSLEIVSIGQTGEFASGGLFIGADLSSDLRYVVFATSATNMAPNAPPLGSTQIYLRDRLLGTTEIVSGEPMFAGVFYGNLSSYWPRITADGSFVFFATDFTNFSSTGLNGSKRDILRWERATGEFTMVNTAPGVVSLNLPSDLPACSDDGRYVAFVTAAPNALPRGMEDLPILPRVYVKDMLTGSLTLASVATDGTPGNGVSNRPSLDASGRLLAFDSLSTNLGPGASAAGRVWVRDLDAGVTSLVDVAQGGEGLAGTASAPALSADGAYVALSARTATNPDFPLIETGVVRVRLATGETLRISRSGSGIPLANCYGGTAISGDGRTVLFATVSGDLVPFDTNDRIDIFARTLPTAPEDLDGDGSVGPLDLAILLGSWGQPDPSADLDGDGVVGATDLARILGAWTA